MITQRMLALMAGIACSVAFAGEVSAQGYGYPGYWDIGQLYRQLDSQVPYFAAHPPVYYSYPVARPYGHSPFAYLPSVQAPAMVPAPVKPQEILNPFTSKATKPNEAGADRTTQAENRVQPLLVINPYFSQTVASNSSPLKNQ